MPRVVNLLGSPELYALHPLAPWAAYAIQVVASTDADPDGWIGGFRATPTAWAAILGPAGQHAGATVETLADARDAMVNGGLLQAVDDRVRLEDADERRRRGNRERQRARRERACDSHATVTRDSHATVTATVTQPVTPPVTQPTVTPGHDAPAGSTCDQDRHYLGIPSGCSKKEGEREGGVGEGNANPADPVGQCLPLPGMAPPSPASPGGFTPRDAHALIALAKVDREDPDAPLPVRLTTYFLARLLEVKPDRKLPTDAILARWVNDMRLLLKDRDNREADIRAVIAWAMTDTRFWQTALQSPGKLRSAFDELEGKARAARRLSAPPPPAPVMRLVYSESIEASIAASKSMKPTDVMRMFPDRTVPDVVAEAQRDYPALALPDAITALKARYDEQREVCHA